MISPENISIFSAGTSPYTSQSIKASRNHDGSSFGWFKMVFCAGKRLKLSFALGKPQVFLVARPPRGGGMVRAWSLRKKNYF